MKLRKRIKKLGKFKKHINESLTELLNMQLEDQLLFVKENPIIVTFNGVTIKIRLDMNSLMILGTFISGVYNSEVARLKIKQKV